MKHLVKKLAQLLALVTLLTSVVPLAMAEAYPSQSGKTFDFNGEKIVVYTREGEQSNALQAMIPEFEKRYNAKVELAMFPNDILTTKITTALASGSSEYDVLVLTWDQTMVDNGWVEPLDGYMNDPDIVDADFDAADFIPALLDAGRNADGTLYALPFKPDVMIYYYRKDLFEDPVEQAAFKEKYGYDLAPAKTWEQYMDIAAFFTRPEEDLYGSLVMAANENQLYNAMYCRMLGTGSRWFDADYMPQVDTDAFKMALTQLVEEVNNYCTPACTNWAYADANTEWLAGRAAQLISWPGVSKISEEADGATGSSKIVGKVGYATVPGYENGTPGCVMGGWNIWVSAFSEKKLAAYKFAEFTVSKAGDELKRPTGCDSARSSINEVLAATDPFYAAMAENFAISVPQPTLVNWNGYQQVMRTEVHAAIMGLKSVDEVAESIQAQWIELLENDGYR